MRQYVILYKRGTGKDFARLNLNDHAKLIDHDEVREAVELMRKRPFLEGTCVRLEDELFNIISLTQDALAPNAFAFAESTQEHKRQNDQPLRHRQGRTGKKGHRQGIGER